MRRRKDYWGEKARANVGINNFDELRFTVVRDENLAFEMFKKGELDAYGGPTTPLRARQWAEDLNFDYVQRGLIQKREVFNANPQGTQGFAFNTRKPPFNDIRVRKALTLLLDRPQIIEKIKFNVFKPLNSYFADSPYENPDNPKNDYDPQQAIKLLADAGWNSRDSQGRLVKNGVPLQFEMLYESKTVEPELTVYQEDLRKSRHQHKSCAWSPPRLSSSLSATETLRLSTQVGAGCFSPIPRRSGSPRSPTRTTTTTSPDSRMRAWIRFALHMTRCSMCRSELKPCAKSTGS